MKQKSDVSTNELKRCIINRNIPQDYPQLSLERWGQWRALDMLCRAFRPNLLHVEPPRIKKLVVTAPIPAEGLPGFIRHFPSMRPPIPVPVTTLFAHLTIFHVKLATSTFNWDTIHNNRTKAYMRDFLALLPNTITDLSIEFPQDRSRTLRRALGLIPVYPCFGNTCFDPVIFPPKSSHHRGIPIFPRLEKLHFANLSLHSPYALQAFLHAHSYSLRHLTLTTLALPTTGWRPFLQWFSGSMSLDVLELASNLTSEEVQAEKKRVPFTRGQIPRESDYRGTAVSCIIPAETYVEPESDDD